MDKKYTEIAKELLKMVQEDYYLQNKLAKETDLIKNYHPELEKLHLKNAENLRKIIFQIGWPTEKKVGREAAYAALVILQNAINSPDLYRECIPILLELAKNREVNPREVAVLYDRMCYFEMRPQKFGTQFEYDETGNLNPWKLENIEMVNVYRKQMDLPLLNDSIKKVREIAEKTNQKPTKDYNDFLEERKRWAKKVGWIK